MPNFIKRATIIITLVSAIVILFFNNFDASSNRIIRYDCRDAHWHPDVPVEVKQECQRIMYERWKKEQEKKQSKIST